MKQVGGELEVAQVVAPIDRPLRGRHIDVDGQQGGAAGRRGQRQGDAFTGKADLFGRLEQWLAFGKAVARRRPFDRPDATERQLEDRVDTVELPRQIKLGRVGTERVVQPADLELVGIGLSFKI